MEKRQPLSVMIALQSKKMRGGDDEGKAPSGERSDDSMNDGGDVEDGGKYDDPGLISASEDAIDAFKNRDAKALTAALCHFLEIHASLGEEPDEDDRRN